MKEDRIVSISERLYEKLNKQVEVQKETIALLTTQLNNEKLKNDNLDLLVRASDKNLTKPIED
jgi:hypothetical protein